LGPIEASADRDAVGEQSVVARNLTYVT
jgi:hypothetical protein